MCPRPSGSAPTILCSVGEHSVLSGTCWLPSVFSRCHTEQNFLEHRHSSTGPVVICLDQAVPLPLCCGSVSLLMLHVTFSALMNMRWLPHQIPLFMHLEILKIHSSLLITFVSKQWLLRQAQWNKGLREFWPSSGGSVMVQRFPLCSRNAVTTKLISIYESPFLQRHRGYMYGGLRFNFLIGRAQSNLEEFPMGLKAGLSGECLNP